MFRKLVSSMALSMPVRNCSSNWWHGQAISNIMSVQPRGYSFQILRSFQTTRKCQDLMEFFDAKKNWGETQIRVGRSWKLDELRIKSNSDLHKLWYVLLKERNMLMTMEAECKRACEIFPNPERLDKVDESMKNLETVVRERNKAFNLLETGETGERPGAEEENFLGLQEYRQFDEHTVPKSENKSYLIAQRDAPKISRKEKGWFLIRWKEKQRRERRKLLQRHQFEVIQLLTKFPDLDVELLKERYPDVKVDRYVERFLKNFHVGNMKTNTQQLHFGYFVRNTK